jgi:hypothetical protein
MVELSSVIPIRHKHHTLPFLHGSTYFRMNRTQYQWKSHKELREEGSNVCLARFEEAKDEKIGTIIVTQGGQGLMDVAVITCLIDQERADERKVKVCD